MTIYHVVFMGETIGYYTSEDYAFEILIDLVFKHWGNTSYYAELMEEIVKEHSLFDLDTFIELIKVDTNEVKSEDNSLKKEINNV